MNGICGHIIQPSWCSVTKELGTNKERWYSWSMVKILSFQGIWITKELINHITHCIYEIMPPKETWNQGKIPKGSLGLVSKPQRV